mgnify:CR=1 FL=1
MFERIKEDMRTILERDPAALGPMQVIFSIPACMRWHFIAPLTGVGFRAGTVLPAGSPRGAFLYRH